MFPLNMNTQKRYPFSEKPAINNFYQMFHREPSFMSDTRNQCLQLVPYMKRVLCTSKDAEYLLTRIRFSCQEPEQIVQIYFITMLGKESKRRKVKKPWVTSALYSPFIPLQLSEGNALSTDPLQTEAKGTISSALYTEDRTLNSPQYHSFSTVLLIWKVSKHMTVSAVFQGHKGIHKHKSLPPPIANPPPSKSSLAVLPETYAIWKPSFTPLLEPRSKPACGTIYTAAICKGKFTPVNIYFDVV